jgi:O-succinylbenzoate synthase
MKIDRISLYHISIPLVEPFRISNGVIEEKDAILVRIDADGATGWGEASPMAGTFYSPDTPESVWEDLTGLLIPRVLAGGDADIGSVNGILEEAGGSPFARAGLETACWDLDCRIRGVPLHGALGGTSLEIVSGLAAGIYPRVSDLLQTIERYLKDGYRRVKIKIQPGWDFVPLRAVRRAFGDIPLMVDANAAYGREDTRRLRALDEFGLMMIEQPLAGDDLEGHALLQQGLSTPVCIDESAESNGAVRRAINLGSCRIVNIKVQRVGGLAAGRAMHNLCAEAGIPVWAGTMPELGIGGIQTAHLASLPNFRFPTDVQASDRWFREEIIEPPITVHDGLISLPSGPGNGVAVREEAIRHAALRKETFVP